MSETPEPYIVAGQLNKLDRIQWAHREIDRLSEMIMKGFKVKVALNFAGEERLACLEHWQAQSK